MTTLQKDLAACKVDGQVVKLPTEPLEDYPALKKALTKAGGKYKRSTFIFDYDPTEVIQEMIDGGSTNRQKDFQFFESPRPLLTKC